MLMLLPNSTGQLAWALAISILFASTFKELVPFYETSTDELFHTTGWILVWCIVGLLLRDLSNAVGPDSDMYMDDGSISAVLVRFETAH